MSLIARATVLCLAAFCFLSVGSVARADHITYRFSIKNQRKGFDDDIHLHHASGVLPTSITTTPAPIDVAVRAFSLTPPWENPVRLYLTLKDKTSSGVTYKKTVYLGLIHGPGWDLDFRSIGRRKVTFGDSVYNVNFVADTIHPAGLFLTRGSLDFTVTDPSVSPTPPSTTPEPSSFVLAGIGVPLLGLLLRRRKR